MALRNPKFKNKGKQDHHRFQQILVTAAKVFRTKGYHHATVQDIANEIGMQKGSLYYYINGKEELLSEIINSAVDMYMESLLEIMNLKERADTVLKKAIIAHMQNIETENDKIYVFLNEFQSLSEEYRKEAEEKIDQYESLLKLIMDRGQADGIFKPEVDGKIMLLGIVGMCNWTARWYKFGHKYNMKDIAEIYANSILNGITKN